MLQELEMIAIKRPSTNDRQENDSDVVPSKTFRIEVNFDLYLSVSKDGCQQKNFSNFRDEF